MSQATEYNSTLERINSVGMAWYIVDSMSDEIGINSLKDRVKGNLVLQIVESGTICDAIYAAEGAGSDGNTIGNSSKAP